MAQEIEIEFKNLLTIDEYNKLLKHIPFPTESQIQTNYYFETKHRSLQELGCALRIREKNNFYQLTLKEPHEKGLLETHDTLSKEEADNWIQGKLIEKPETMARLKDLGIHLSSLHCFGSLTTKRKELYKNNIIFVLDYSFYNGKSDYELELEADTRENGFIQFQELLQHYQIPRRKTPNKVERFFASFEN